MAKRTCDPTTGSIGSQTYMIGRNGQVVRARIIPANPKTEQQVLARANFQEASKAWDDLTDEQRAAWISAADGIQSRSRLGMSGKLTGNQYFVKVNAALLEAGASKVTSPPAAPTFLGVDPTALVIAGGIGARTVKLTNASSNVTGMQVWCAAPVNQGVNRTPNMVHIGALPAPGTGVNDITSLVTARFGVVPNDKKLFVAVREVLSGVVGTEVVFSATAPSS
jgi:hypothetical protein